MFSLFSFFHLEYLSLLSLVCLVHVSHLRQKKFASTKLLGIMWFRTVSSIQHIIFFLIFERSFHSVADLRERSRPRMGGGGGSGRFPVKKKISFCE